MILKHCSSVTLMLLCFSVMVICKLNIKYEKQMSNSGTELMAERFSSIMFNIGQRYFDTAKVIQISLPQYKIHGNLFHVLDKTVHKLSTYWSVISTDTYCCDTIDEWILSYESTVRFNYAPDIYIFPFDENRKFENFENQLKQLEREDRFNHKARFLIVQLTDKCYEWGQSNNKTARIFQRMWSINLFATTILILSECDLHLTTVIARPYSSQNSCLDINKADIKYTRLPLSDVDISKIHITLFQYEWNDLKGCLFWAGTAPFSPYVVGKRIIIENKIHYEYVGGIDIELIRVFSAKKGFVYKFSKTHTYELVAWFEKFPNGTVVGILQDVLRHNVDIAFGGLIPSYVSYCKYDYSPSYKFSAVSFYVTDANVIPQWKIFFGTFPPEIWILLVIVFLTVCLLYYFMDHHKLSSSKPFYKYIFKRVPLSNLFSLALGFSSTLNPQSSSLRALFCSWSLYSMLWYTAYTTMLFILLTNPPYEKEITTIQELQDSGLRIVTDPLYLEYFGHIELDHVTKSILDNRIECHQVETCIREFVQFRNYSVMEKEENVELRLNLDRSKVHKLSDKMLSFSVSAFTDKGSVLSYELNKLVLICFQSGLIFKWEKDVMLKYQDVKNTDFKSEDDSLPLTTQDLKGAFLILIMGLIVAFIIFIGELLLNMLKEHRSKSHSWIT